MAQRALFRRMSIFDLMERRQRQLRDGVKGLPEAALVDEQLPEELARQYGFEVPILNEVNKHATKEELDVDVSQDPQRVIWDRSRPFYVRGTEVTIHVPFQGDPDLFDVQPTTHSLNPPIGDFDDHELRFAYMIVEPKDIGPEFERTIGEVKQHLDWLRPSAEQLRAQLRQLANSLIAERKERTVAHEAVLGNLGIPIQAAEAGHGRSAMAAAANPSEMRTKATAQQRERVGREQDGVPMVRQKHPGGEQESLARTHRTQGPRQNGEVLLGQVATPGPQFHRQEAETVGQTKMTQPRHNR